MLAYDRGAASDFPENGPLMLRRLTTVVAASAALLGATRPTACQYADPTSKTIAAWIADLADDDVRFNAIRGFHALMHIGERAAPALEQALYSNDHQQRHKAASLLRMIEGRVPSDRLIEVSVEALRDDAVDSNGGRALWFLGDHFERAKPRLLLALNSPDLQQRFFATMIFARQGSSDGIARTTAILIPRLADNDISGDACIATRLLFMLGKPAAPYLSPYLSSSDRQQRELAELIMRELDGPPKTPAEDAYRKSLNRITEHFHYPTRNGGGRMTWFLTRPRYRFGWDLREGKIRLASFDAIRSRVPHEIISKFDHIGLEHFVIAFGTRGVGRFDRLLTLRHWDDGRIERREYGRWVPESLLEPRAK